MLNDLLSSRCCKHWNRESKFRDLHRGGEGEVYFRNTVTCKDCGKSWVDATQLPDLATEVLDEAIYIGTIERR